MNAQVAQEGRATRARRPKADTRQPAINIGFRPNLSRPSPIIGTRTTLAMEVTETIVLL